MADQDVRFLNIITGDGTWYFLYKPQSTCHSCGWKSKLFPEKKILSRQKERQGYTGYFPRCSESHPI
jgi:hypothetical protein